MKAKSLYCYCYLLDESPVLATIYKTGFDSRTKFLHFLAEKIF